MSDASIWTEADQARADLVSEIACEISEDEEIVHMVLGALDERGMLASSAPDVAEALEELLTLKDAKDAGFTTYVEEQAYRARKPLAWDKARAALSKARASHE